MKYGRSVNDLAQEVMRQAQTKHDYVADTSVVTMTPDKDPALVLGNADGGGAGAFEITSTTHAQIAEHTKIPKPYYDRMRSEEPGLLATNVDRWFKKYPAPRLVRTLDGKARAFLSNSYRPLDHVDLVNAVMPVLAERRLNIMSCEITDTRLYLKADDEQLFRDVPVGYRMGDGSHKFFDTCAPAVVISNSEIGFGRLVIETGVFTKVCTNLAMYGDGGMRRTHVGQKHKLLENSGIENIDAILSDRTKAQSDKALWMQVHDIIGAAFDETKMAARIEKLTEAGERRIEAQNVNKIVEVTGDRFAFNEDEKSSVLKFLIEGGNLSQYGLHSAITRAAQDVPDYDRSTELERVGGKVIELAPSEWERMAETA
jgi:hypothetical protein